MFYLTHSSAVQVIRTSSLLTFQCYSYFLGKNALWLQIIFNKTCTRRATEKNIISGNHRIIPFYYKAVYIAQSLQVVKLFQKHLSLLYWEDILYWNWLYNLVQLKMQWRSKLKISLTPWDESHFAKKSTLDSTKCPLTAQY